jgi:VanZ family protein
MDASRPEHAPPARKPHAFLLSVLPALCWLALIFIGGGLDFGPPEIETGLPFDKLQHAVAFAVLGLLFFRALRHVGPGIGQTRLIALSAMLSIAAGVLLELYQLGLPHRSAEVGDLIADTLGACAAAAWLHFRR